MDLKFIIGNLATVLTVASFFSGAIVCLKISKKGTTGDISGFPFIAGSLCCAIWLRYGMYINDSSLIAVNVIGTVLQFCYILCYYLYCINKASLHRLLLMTGIVVSSLAFYLIYVPKSFEEAKFTCGVLACGAGIIFSASPLASAAQVLKSKSSESLPLPIIGSSLVVGSLWFAYGILLDDPFVKVPNFLGIALSSLQLSLFFIYPSKKLRSDQSQLIKK